MTKPRTPLPQPDLTMPSIVPDGPDGAHFYRAATVQELLVLERARWLHQLTCACVNVGLSNSEFDKIVAQLDLPKDSKQVAELLEQRDKALAQLRHLVNDITHCPDPGDPDKRCVKARSGVLFSNMVNAVARMLAKIDKEQGHG